MNESLLFDVDKAVAILTINDEPYNRMSLDFMDELESAVKDIASNKLVLPDPFGPYKITWSLAIFKSISL